MENRIKQKAKHELLNSFFHYYLEWATEYENLSKEHKESVLKQIKYVIKEGWDIKCLDTYSQKMACALERMHQS